MQTNTRASAHVIIKVQPEGGAEKLVGFATSISLNVQQGSKEIFTVDSPFPQEIASGASASRVSAAMSVVLLKGTTLESLGLIPYRTGGGASAKDSVVVDSDGVFGIHVANSRYMHIRLYDRITDTLYYGIEYAKVTGFNLVAQTRSIIRADISFTGLYLIPGQG